jgi:hypothetical protein
VTGDPRPGIGVERKESENGRASGALEEIKAREMSLKEAAIA